MSGVNLDSTDSLYLSEVNDDLEQAFKFGVFDPNIVGLTNFTKDPPMSNLLRTLGENFFKSIIGAVLSLLGGISATIPIAKITPGGTNGQLVFKFGLLTSITLPT